MQLSCPLEFFSATATSQTALCGQLTYLRFVAEVALLLQRSTDTDAAS